MNKLVVDEDGLYGILQSSSTALLKSSARKQKELRAECEALPKRVSEDEKSRDQKGEVDDTGRADDFFPLFYHALDPSVSGTKTLTQAIDGVQRLLIKGFLQGRGKANATLYPAKPGSSTNTDGRLLINVIVDSVSECANYRDSGVQLAVIKCLLTSIHSVNTAVHDQALLSAVIGLWHAYLQPSDEVVRVTAKATLAQCHQLVFTRMEHYGKILRQLEDTYIAYVKHQHQQSQLQTDGVAAEPPAAATTSSKKGRCGVCCVCGSPADHYCSQTADPVCGMPCKIMNLECKDPGMERNTKMRESAQVGLLSYQRDAYLLFRALLKIANKPVPVTPNTSDTTPIESKVLAFHLLLSVLNHSGPVFRSSPPFVLLVKQDLVSCLLKNSSASTSDTLFALASSIFVAVIAHFKPYLHSIIGAVIGETYLPYLASPNASFDHRCISLTVIAKICADPQTLVELFLNYDCDIDSYNTFQKIAAMLEKACQARSDEGAKKDEERQIRELALTALVACMKVLVHWTKRRADMQKGVAEEKVERRETEADGANSDDDTSGDRALSPTATEPDRGTSSSPPPQSISDKFQAQRQQKLRLDNGIFKFNSKPKAGLKYLQDHGLLATDAASVAHFFHTCSGLDKTQMGDYMGEEAPFNKAVLYSYVDQMDFRGLEFDQALRHFVAGFRLPGEAQKIDRMMEKFAEQYHAHNPGVFNIADTAYVLAFSVIMLNVDAHSPNIKKRMTKEEFLRNARGIDDGKDVNPQFMSDIYDRITQNEIKLKDDASSQQAGGEMKRSASLDPKARQSLLANESAKWIAKTEQLIDGTSNGDTGNAALTGLAASLTGSTVSAVPDSDSVVSAMHSRHSAAGSDRPFYIATDADCEVVKPMFEILWYPALATFSMILEESESELWINLCLDGYRLAIKVSTELELDTARLAFVSSLRKFTLLGSTKEMKSKNLQAVKVLLNVAHQDGNRLKESWIDVLQCISEVERLHLIGATKPEGDVFKQTGETKLRESDSVNSLAIHRIDPAAIDRVFTGSANLDERAIIDFAMALRQIGELELRDVNNPRVFCMQKIVEVTSYNMGRIRLVWNRVWAILSEFFVKAGCHPNLQVSIFAIDSCRQLAVKFLEKDELTSFQFQKLFFKPFESIMANNTSPDTRELIVQCLQRMIASRAHNIKSGWKAVFVVLGIAAKQEQETLVSAAFDLVAHILDNYYAMINESADTLDECVNCLVAFGCNSNTDTAMKAIARLKTVADFVAANASASAVASVTAITARKASVSDRETSSGGEESRPAPLTVPAASASSSASSSSIRVWFLLLTGLSRLVGDSRLEVRNEALSALFSVLNKHGAQFSAGTWRHIFHGVLFPIFDDVKHASEAGAGGGQAHVLLTRAMNAQPTPPALSPKSRAHVNVVDSSWLTTTCYQALVTLVELFHRFHPSVRFLLPELLSLIASCVVAESDDLARIGLKCLVVLCSLCGESFTVEAWWIVLDAVNDTLHRLMPYQLISAETKRAIGLSEEGNGNGNAPASLATPANSDQTPTAAASSTAANGTTPTTAVPALPFSSASVSLRCRSQSLLLDALHEIVARFFSQRPAASAAMPAEAPAVTQHEREMPAFVDPFHSPTHTAESARQTSSDTQFAYQGASSKNDLPFVSRDASVELPGLARVFDDNEPRSISSRRVYGRLTCAQLLFALDTLHASIAFSRHFNADLKLRQRLHQCGFLLTQQPNRLPQLFALEAHAIKLTLMILFQLHHEAIRYHIGGDDVMPNNPFTDGTEPQSVEEWRAAETAGFDWLCALGRARALSVSSSLLSSYSRKAESGQLSSLEGSDGYIVAIVDHFGALEQTELVRLLPQYYYPLTDLAQFAQTDAIRAALRKLLQARIADLLSVPRRG